MTLNGGTSTAQIIGLGGTSTDLWAVQDNGTLFHSTGGAFSFLFSMPYGAKDLYSADGTVVIVQNRALRTCTANCTTETAFATFDLISPNSLYGEAVCGRGGDDITVVVSDTQDAGQLFHWNGSQWTRTNVNLGVRYPRACWFDESGALYVVGQDVVIRDESGASTTETLSSNLTGYYGGGAVGGTSWVVGPNHYVARRNGTTWMPFTVSGTTSTLWAVGGLSEDEVYAFGGWQTTAGNGFKWNGTALTPVGNLLPNTGSQSSIRTMLVTAPNELFVAGSNQAGPIIIRGRR